ncbi:unnamed protein product [Chrysoparadoxa australica]
MPPTMGSMGSEAMIEKLLRSCGSSLVGGQPKGAVKRTLDEAPPAGSPPSTTSPVVHITPEANIDFAYGSMLNRLGGVRTELEAMQSRSEARLQMMKESTARPQPTPAAATSPRPSPTPPPAPRLSPKHTPGGGRPPVSPEKARRTGPPNPTPAPPAPGAAAVGAPPETPLTKRRVSVAPGTGTPSRQVLGAMGAMSVDGSPVGIKETPPPGLNLNTPSDARSDEALILSACHETARWMTVGDKQNLVAYKFLKECMRDTTKVPGSYELKKKNIATPAEYIAQAIEACTSKVRETLAVSPELASYRHLNTTAEPMDGWTPLHSAAFAGNLAVVQLLAEEYKVSTWAVDLQGRTALALAASKGRVDVCKYLKRQMKAEANHGVVGSQAPVDLSGTTPLGWSVKAKARVNEHKEEVRGVLYEKGDHSVCPDTPMDGRMHAPSHGLPFAIADMPGWRITMEDATCAHTPIPGEWRGGMFGVFDGHGGASSSEYVSEHLLECLCEQPSWRAGERGVQAVVDALTQAFLDVDDQLAALPQMKVTLKGEDYHAVDCSGSTGAVVLVTETHVIAANVGDSRCVLVIPEGNKGVNGAPTAGIAELTQDHSAELPGERERVQVAGGEVIDVQGVQRICYKVGNKSQSVCPSRAFGDFAFKQRSDLPPQAQVVVAVPEVRACERDGIEGYLLLACDGLWDVMSNKEAGDILLAVLHEATREGIEEKVALAKAADELVAQSLRRGSLDNVTVCVVRLPEPTADEAGSGLEDLVERLNLSG